MTNCEKNLRSRVSVPSEEAETGQRFGTFATADVDATWQREEAVQGEERMERKGWAREKGGQ
ncbi:hypothetical protein K0M31_013470, partial [Melipona bicolor]